MPWGSRGLDAVRAASAERFMDRAALARVHHERSDDRVFGQRFLTSAISRKLFRRTITNEFDIVEPDHARVPDLARSSARKR